MLFLATLSLLLPTVNAQSQVTLKQASFNLAANTNVVSKLTTVQMLVYRQTTSQYALWQPNVCFEVKITNPYLNPSEYSTFKSSNPPVCSSNSPNSYNASCNMKSGTTDTLQFRFPAIQSSSATAASLALSISNFNTPYSSQQLNVTVTAYSDAACSVTPNVLQISAVTINLAAMPYTSVSVTSSSNQLGQNNQTALQVQFTPATTMSPGKSGAIKIGIPYLYGYVPSFDATQVNTCTSACMNVVNSTLVGGTTLVIFYNQMTSVCVSATPITINCIGYQNPIFQSNNQWGFTVSTFDDQPNMGGIEVSGTSYIDSSQYLAAYIPGSDFLVTPSNYQVNTFSTWELHLSIPIPMILGCYITLDIPEDFDLSPQQIQAIGIFTPPSLNPYLATTDYSMTTPNATFFKTSITFKGCNDGASIGAQPSGDLYFSQIATQKGNFNSGAFGIRIYKDVDLTMLIAYLDQFSVYIPGSLIITGPITSISVYPTLNQIVQQTTYMMINFTISSPLFFNAKVQIQMPSGFTLPKIGQTTDVVGLQGTTSANVGTILANNIVEILNLVTVASVPPGYTFKLAINQVTNQLSTKDAGPIIITTFYFQNSTQQFFKVDTGTNSTSFTASVGTINSVNGVKVVINNPTNSATGTTYTLVFTGQNQIPAGGFLTISIPIELFVDTQAVILGGSCSDTVNWSSCTYSAANQTIRIKTLKGFVQQTDITIIIAGITNARSYQPSSSFIITSSDVDGVARIDTGFNQNIQNSQPGLVTTFTVQPSSVVNGDSNTYTFALSSLIPLIKGDVISFAAPSQILLPQSNSSNICFATNQTQLISCGISGQNVLITYQSAGPISNILFSIVNVTNPASVQGSAGFTNISVSNVNSYLVAQFQGASLGITNQQPAVITTAQLYQDGYTFSSQTNYTIKFTPVNALPATGSIVVRYPSQVILNSGVNTICLVTTNRVYQKSCLVDPVNRNIIITKVFAASISYSASITIILQNVTNPMDNTPSLRGFTLQTFADAGQVYIEDTLNDYLLVPILSCDYPCATCSNSSRTDCQSCWQFSPNINLTYQMSYNKSPGQCKTSCDFGFSSNGSASRLCQSCDQSCVGCVDNGQAGDASRCLSCSAVFPFWLSGTQTCISGCGLGYFQSSANNCSVCNSPCQGCSGTADTCTSCNQNSTNPNLYQSQCIATCPTGTISIAGVCTPCNSPCKSCSGSVSICSACDGSSGRSILLGNTCLSSCPNGTVLGANKTSCLGCLSGCQICDNTNVTNCLTCNPGLVLIGGACSGTCPAGYVASGTGCISKGLSDLAIMYFPFLIMAAILSVIVLFGKCKKKGQLVKGKSTMVSLQNTLTSELVFVAMIQILCNCSLFILAYAFNYPLLSILSLIVAVINIVLNCIYQNAFIRNTAYSILLCCISKKPQPQSESAKAAISQGNTPGSGRPKGSLQKSTELAWKDKSFSDWYHKHTIPAIIIMGLTATCHMKFTKMFYSHFYSFDLFKAQFSNDELFIKTMNRFALASFLLVDVLMIAVGFIGLATIKWNSQVYIECIEVIVLSVISALLTGVERYQLNKILGYIRRQKMLQEQMGIQALVVKLKLSTKYGHLIIAKSYELLMVEFGFKKCRSFIMHQDNEEDLRQLHSWPSSPNTRYQLKIKGLDIENGVKSLKMNDNVYHDVYQKIKGKDRGTQGNASQVDWQEALNRKHGDLMTQIDIDEEMRIRKGARRRGRKNKYYNQIDQEDDEEVDYEEASDRDADLQIIKEQEEEEEMLRQVVATETQKQVEAVAARKSKLVQELSNKETEEKATAEARRLKLMDEDERRRAKELAEALKQEKEIQARKKLQEEAALESARRTMNEQQKAQEALVASQKARIEYEAKEAERLKALAQQQESLEAEEAVRVAAEITAQQLEKQQTLEQIERERTANDTLTAGQKRLAQEEEDRKRALEKLALKEQREKEEASRKAAELAEKQTKLDEQALQDAEAKAIKDKKKQDEVDSKGAQNALKEAEKKAAEDLKLKKEMQAKIDQDEKNKLRDQEKAEKLASQVPPPPQKKETQPLASIVENIEDKLDDFVQTPALPTLAVFDEQADLKIQTQQVEPVLVPQQQQKKEAAPEENQRKEELPLAATSVIKQQPQKATADVASVDAFSEFPVNDAYQASANEQSLRHMKSLNQSEDIDQNSSMIAMNENLLKDFKKTESLIDIPPNAELRTFNENDVLGDLDRDEKGNLVYQDSNGRSEDKKGEPINQRGYLVNLITGDVVDSFNKQPMFLADDLDDRGELPAPFCIEKFNFNPHNLLGYFDYTEGHPLMLQTSKGFFVDKTGRRVNKKGWLTMGASGHLVDKHGRKRFDKKQLTIDGDLPKLFTYGGKRFDVKDTIGVFERDQNGAILTHQHANGVHLADNLGRRVNQKGYLIDEQGNIIDVNGKQLFKATDLLSGEYPKIFPFTKFNIQKVQGEFNLNPNGTPQLIKQKIGGFADRLGRPVNARGYLVDARGNIVDTEGNLMFQKIWLEGEGEIPQVFRTGLLRSDTASSLSRLMSEIERNNQSEFDRNGFNAQANDSNYDKFRQHDGDTSLDSKMEDTPANYNLANQRFDEREEDQQAIPEDDEAAEHYAPSSGFEDNFEPMPRQKKLKKPKKKKPKVATIEFLEPTKRDRNMAGAYGGMAKGEIRRPGIKYDKDRLTNSKKFRVATADEPRVRAQLAQLANTVGGFNPEASIGIQNRDGKPRPKLQGLLGNSAFDQDKDSSQSKSMQAKQLGKNRSQKQSEIQPNRKGVNDGDFEQMFGKDIDKFLEDSEWDIQSADQVSRNSRGSSRSGAREVKIKAMEKVYLKRLEANEVQQESKQQRRSQLRSDSQSRSPPRRVPREKPVKGPDRETIISFSDNPGVIHRGEVLPFATKWQ